MVSQTAPTGANPPSIVGGIWPPALGSFPQQAAAYLDAVESLLDHTLNQLSDYDSESWGTESMFNKIKLDCQDMLRAGHQVESLGVTLPRVDLAAHAKLTTVVKEINFYCHLVESLRREHKMSNTPRVYKHAAEAKAQVQNHRAMMLSPQAPLQGERIRVPHARHAAGRNTAGRN